VQAKEQRKNTGMQATYGSVAELAAALRRAEAAHGKHEAKIGHPDPDWPDWYAHYMMDEQAGRPSAGTGDRLIDDHEDRGGAARGG
jgi:hypothetical protein